MELLNEIKNGGSQIEFILMAKKGSMALYHISKEALMESSSFDFMVYGFNGWDDEVLEGLGEWDDYELIDETTYYELYYNLCIKLRAFLKYL